MKPELRKIINEVDNVISHVFNLYPDQPPVKSFDGIKFGKTISNLGHKTIFPINKKEENNNGGINDRRN